MNEPLDYVLLIFAASTRLFFRNGPRTIFIKPGPKDKIYFMTTAIIAPASRVGVIKKSSQSLQRTNGVLPVHPPFLHGDEVGCAWRQDPGVHSEGVGWVIPPGQGEGHPRLEGVVIEPGGVLVDVREGAQRDGHPLSHTRGRRS